MRSRYAFALTILGAYFIASYFILHGAIEQQRSMQRVIAVSGQQRMYAQRIAMFADAIVARPNLGLRNRAVKDLETSIRIFSQAHHALTRGWDPPKVRQIFFSQPYEVDLQAREYLAHARTLDRRAQRGPIRADDKDLDYLLSVGPGILLESLDAVVAAYTDEQRTAVATFEALQIGLLLLGLSTLVAIWLTILLPLEREIAERTAAMELGASTDSLTGILNRKAFATAVESALARTLLANASGAMLMVDIDNFKVVNDTFGHGIGDDTLVRVAEIMRAHARGSDIVARFGGDEFALFAPAFDSDASLRAFVERLCEGLQYDASFAGATHRVTASIGVARAAQDGTTQRELLAAADRALYSAKRSGRARHAFCTRDAAHVSENVPHPMFQATQTGSLTTKTS